MKESFPPNYALLLAGPPGVGKFEYSIDLVRYWLESGEKVVFVTVDLHPQEVQVRGRALGFDLKPHLGKSLAFIDCFSPTVTDQVASPDPFTFTVSSFSNLEGIGIAIGKAVDALKPPVRVVFYTVSTLFLHNSPQAIAKFLQIMTARVKTHYGFVIYAVQDGVHDDKTMNLLRSLVDGVLEMRFDDVLHREMRVHHMRGLSTKPEWLPFSLEPEGFVMSAGTEGWMHNLSRAPSTRRPSL